MVSASRPPPLHPTHRGDPGLALRFDATSASIPTGFISARRHTTGSASADQPISISAAEPPREQVAADAATQLTDRVASSAEAGPSGSPPGTVFSTNDFSLVMPAGFLDKQPPPPPGAGFGNQPVRSTLGAQGL